MSDPRIRTLNWNVLYRDLERRAEGLADAIASVGPDLVLLQETNPSHAAETAERLGMVVVGCGPAEAAGTITSVPAILARFGAVDPSPDPGLILTDAAKTYAVVHPFAVGGRRLIVASIHLTHTAQAGRMALDHDVVAAAQGGATVADIADPTIRDSVRARLAQLDALEAAVRSLAGDGDPILLGGDFNFVPRGPEYRRVLDAGFDDAWESGPRLGSRDTIIEHNPLISDGPGVYDVVSKAALTGTTGPLDYTLDYQFVAGLRCRAAWVVGRPDPVAPIWHSDHLGVATDHEIVPGRTASVA